MQGRKSATVPIGGVFLPNKMIFLCKIGFRFISRVRLRADLTIDVGTDGLHDVILLAKCYALSNVLEVY